MQDYAAVMVFSPRTRRWELMSDGGRVIVAPNTDASVIRAARDRGLGTMPAAATPTEAFTALGKGSVAFPVASLAEHYRHAFHAQRESGGEMEPLYPGAAAAIQALAQRDDVVLGVATGKSQRGVRLVLGHHGLLDHFITIKTADDAPSKPDPGMVVDASA